MFASDRTLIWLSVWLCCMVHLYGQPQPVQEQQQYQQQYAPVRAFSGLQRGPATVQRTPPQSQTVKQQPTQMEITWEKIELIELPVIREQQQSQPQSYYQQPTNRQRFEAQAQSIRLADESNAQKLQNQQYRRQQLQAYPNRPQLQIPKPQSRIVQQQHQQTLQQAEASYQQLQQQQQLPQQQQQSFPNYKYQPLAEGLAPSDGLVQYENVNNTKSTASGVPSSTSGSASATTTMKPPDAQINLLSPEADFSNDANATMTCEMCCDPMERPCSSCCDVVPFLSSQTLKTAAG